MTTTAGPPDPGTARVPGRVSATLAANEALAARRRRGEPAALDQVAYVAADLVG